MTTPLRTFRGLLVSVMLVVTGVIHLLPLSGVLGSERLAALYGLPFDEPNLEILMRHRAVLFGLMGSFLIFAAFKPAYRTVAYIGGLISAASFLYLAWAVGGYNEQIGRVFMADIVALACLVVGGAAHVFAQRATSAS
ncbi:MAG TPA: phosphopantetheine adenylyltransferase [Thermoanaerobaculia bacterium]|nr:phosphopantetheine adenylyltransferase [Thermoanaerobaculia bacterium]